MKKPGPNFKMSRASKIYLAVNWHRPNRGARKRSTIQAELYSTEVVRNKRDRGDS